MNSNFFVSLLIIVNTIYGSVAQSSSQQSCSVQQMNPSRAAYSCSPPVASSDVGTKVYALNQAFQSAASTFNIVSNSKIGPYNIWLLSHTYNGVTVFGSVGQITYFYTSSSNNEIASVTAHNFVQVPDGVSTTTTVSGTTAVQRTLAAAGCVSPSCTATSSSYSTIVYAVGSIFKVGYLVNVTTTKSTIDRIIAKVDGNTGIVDSLRSDLRTVSTPAVGLGTYNDTFLSFNSNLYGHNTYYLEDVTRQHAVLDCQATNCSTPYRIYSSQYPTFNTTNATRPAVMVQWSASKFYDYFSTVWNRTGIDGLNGPSEVTSVDGSTQLTAHYINYGPSVTTSAWTSTGIYYGTGDAVNYGPVVSLDTVGHEMMHGVISYIVAGGTGFTYSGETCALEESYCDVFGNVVERWVNGESANTWTVGEEYYTPSVSGDALRSLSNPRSSPDIYSIGSTYPDHYSNLYTGIADNGGCHINSGIASKAFYLLAKGGSNLYNTSISMSGIGVDKAANIWYSALPLMSSTTSFADAASHQLTTAQSIFGALSGEAMALQTSWALCGVGSLPNPNMTNYIINPGFEAFQNPWVVSGLNGAVWVKCCSGNTLVQTGRPGFIGFALLGQNMSVTASVYQIVPAMPTTIQSAQLSFYVRSLGNDMSPSSLDTLTISVKNATSGALFGIVDTFHSNTNVYATYTKTSLYNMAAFAGKGNLRIEFGVSNDASTSATTWYIDDVYLNVTSY